MHQTWLKWLDRNNKQYSLVPVFCGLAVWGCLIERCGPILETKWLYTQSCANVRLRNIWIVVKTLVSIQSKLFPLLWIESYFVWHFKCYLAYLHDSNCVVLLLGQDTFYSWLIPETNFFKPSLTFIYVQDHILFNIHRLSLSQSQSSLHIFPSGVSALCNTGFSPCTTS